MGGPYLVWKINKNIAFEQQDNVVRSLIMINMSKVNYDKRHDNLLLSGLAPFYLTNVITLKARL